MQISRDERVRIERAHVVAWPALRTAVVGGWLWRFSGGGSQRANSVSTIDFVGDDPDAAVREVEARYRAIGAIPRFQTFAETVPPELPDLLRQRGFIEAEPTITMVKRAPEDADDGSGDSQINDRASPDWLAVYLEEISENRRQVNGRIIDRISAPSVFVGVRRNGRIVATALCVIGYGCAVIECVATRVDARRQGAARSALQAAGAWAATQSVQWISLQVAAHNIAAIRLYQGLGFSADRPNRFWMLP